MMLFFGKKKEPDRPAPEQEVQRMQRMGMSDREVIKYLKAQGYAYPEIEKAMMSVIKKGVGAEPQPQFEGAPPSPQAAMLAPPGAQAPEPAKLPELPEMEEQPTFDDEFGLPSEQELDINPEVIVEELVEGVVAEKWTKFEERAAKLEDEVAQLQEQIKQTSEHLQSAGSETHSKEVEMKIHEMAEQMEELQARVGGLEKAFKQFLPSLTKNIESLAHMIHEMKEKKGVVEA